jgi:hypothetical protein
VLLIAGLIRREPGQLSVIPVAVKSPLLVNAVVQVKTVSTDVFKYYKHMRGSALGDSVVLTGLLFVIIMSLSDPMDQFSDLPSNV